MESINLKEVSRFETTGHSSKGNQLKWHHEDAWYKADYMGYEGLAEVLISRLLRQSDAAGVVDYEPVWIQYGGRNYCGCRSRNFLLPGEELITIGRLFRQFTGRNLTKEMARLPSVKERILYMVENVQEFTGLYGFGQYLTAALTIDAFFLNEDRHTNNLAVIYQSEIKEYRLCPYFDHGLSLFSDITTDFSIETPIEECRKRMEAKPFSRDFDEQLDEAELLYGKQITFSFGKKNVREELTVFEGIYEAAVIGRVEELLYQQIGKYKYLFIQA